MKAPMIDHYSLATLPLEMRFGGVSLSWGTGFIWQHAEQFYLITNWHNVSGRDPFSQNHLSPTAAEPDRLHIVWNEKGSTGKVPAELPIRGMDGEPLWLIHPALGNKVDVVAVPVKPPPDADPYPINHMPSGGLLLQIGMDVFILGYPFGIGPHGLPVWKRGSIATEPNVINHERPFILVDSASRPGMSGSPVIRRTVDYHPMESGELTQSAGTMTRLVGVYSGRLATNDPNDPQLGLTWPIGFVEEIITGKIVDS